MPFKTIIDRVQNHFSPQPLEITCCHAFYKRDQALGESVTMLVTTLQQVVHHCSFKDLETTLRDQLVWWLHNEKLQRRLFAKKELTFKTAFEEAIVAEATDQSAQEAPQTRSPAPAQKAKAVHQESLKEELEEDQGVLQMWIAVHKHTDSQQHKEPLCDNCGGSDARKACWKNWMHHPHLPN